MKWHQTPDGFLVAALWCQLQSEAFFFFSLFMRSLSSKFLVGHGLKCIRLFARGRMSKEWCNLKVIGDVQSGPEWPNRHLIPDKKNSKSQQIFSFSTFVIYQGSFLLLSSSCFNKMWLQTPVHSFYTPLQRSLCFIENIWKNSLFVRIDMYVFILASFWEIKCYFPFTQLNAGAAWPSAKRPFLY